jgi:DNA processing protein
MNGSSNRSRFRLALDRVPFLRARDKIRVDSVLDGESDLSLLSPKRLEEILGRRLGIRSRNRAEDTGPEALAWKPVEWETWAERDLAWFRSAGVSFVAFGDADFPPLLRETSRPPFILYYRGCLPNPDLPLLGMVGTRYPTGKGLEAAFRLAGQAANVGVFVVSGLARGIDAASHRGAVEAGGKTWAVLGNGIDSVYPIRNRELAARIVETGGGLLSEYPPGAEPLKYHFPERNRILAGLCRAVLVVEAPKASGALITADFALDEGRDVAVAAACLSGPRSEGCAGLCKDGAPAISDIVELTEGWGKNPGKYRCKAGADLFAETVE